MPVLPQLGPITGAPLPSGQSAAAAEVRPSHGNIPADNKMKDDEDLARKKFLNKSKPTSVKQKQIRFNEPKKDFEESSKAESDSEGKPGMQCLKESTREESKSSHEDVEKCKKTRKDHSIEEKTVIESAVKPDTMPTKILVTGKEHKKYEDESSSEDSSSSTEEFESNLQYTALTESTSQEQLNFEVPDVSATDKKVVEEDKEVSVNKGQTPNLATSEVEDNKSIEFKKSKQRLFLKVPNENAVFVPLHGSSSDDDISVENKLKDSANPEILKLSDNCVTYSEAPNKYAVLVPLKSVPGEELKSYEEDIQMKNSNENDKQKTKVAEPSEKVSEPSEKLGMDIEVESLKDDKNLVKHKRRLFLKIPNQNAVIVPLHGSSDEDQNTHADDDDGLVFTPDSTPSTSSKIDKLTCSNVEKSTIYSEAPNEYGIIVPLHSFPEEEHFIKGENYESLSGATFSDKDQMNSEKDKSNNEQASKESEDISKQLKEKQHLFLKVSNKNTVYAPLNGSSDDEQKETVSDLSESVADAVPIQTLQHIYAGKTDEYSKYVPLHASYDEQPGTSNENVTTRVLNSTTGKDKVEQTSEKETGIMENEKSSVPIQQKQRLFFKVPNQNAVIVPLHGSSDEEEEVIDEDDGLIQNISARTPSSPESSPHLVTRRKSSAKKIVMYDVEPNEYGLIIPLHGLPDEQEFLARQEITESVSQLTSADSTENIDKREENQASPDPIKQSATVKKKHRIFMKVPNENAVYVPLHGSSDEEEISSQAGTISSDHKDNESCSKDEENVKSKKVEVVYAEAPNEYDVLVPLHGIPGEQQKSQTNEFELTVYGSVSTVNEDRSAILSKENTQANQKDDSESQETKTKSVKKEQHPFFKVLNENAVFIPLHGSSEEENLGEKNEEQMASVSFQQIEEQEKETIPTKVEYEEAPNDCRIIDPLDTQPVEKREHLKDSAEHIKEPKKDVGQRSKKSIKKKRAFKKVPNEDAVIIPLHSSTEESFDEIDQNTTTKEANEDNSIIEGQESTGKNKKPVHSESPNEYSAHLRILNTVFLPLPSQSAETKDEVERNTESEVRSLEKSTTSKKEKETKKTGLIAPKVEKKKPILKKQNVAENTLNPSIKSEEPIFKNEVRNENSSNITNEETKSKPKEAEKQDQNTEQLNINTDVEQLIADRIQTLQKDNKSLIEIIMPRTQGMADVVLEVMSKKKDLFTNENNSLQPSYEVPKEKKQLINQSPSNQEEKRDHEYEPIQVPRAASQPDVRSYPLEVNVKRDEEEDRYEVVRPQEIFPVQETTTNLQAEGGYEVIQEPKQEQRRFIKIPNEDAIIIPLHGSSDEEINPDRYQNPSLMMSEDEIERMPTITPTINVHAPEDVATTERHEGTIQERLKSQADRLTTKLKGISKPKISIHKPKIKLPERPNIKMPEMPKLKLSEKFHLPDRPKFNFPDKAKFHLPERPKFHLPEKPKFLTERPKFKLPEKPKFGHHEKKSKPKGKKPNPSSLRRPLRDVVTISSQSTPGSTHNIFETLKFRTYPRFFKKKRPPVVQKMSSLETESSQPSTPPVRPRSYSAHQQDTSWVHAYKDNRFTDEETNLRVERMEEEYEREDNMAPFQESYAGSIKGMVEREFKQGKAESMTSVISEKGSSGSSSNRRRAGVIEEIDSDEFFVREKGLSREDVDVSRYLSLEIRDAFRQPKNALASLDNDLYDYDEQDIPFEHIPRAPQRSKSSKSTSAKKDNEFHTFPKRPSRRKESDPEVVVKPPRRFRSKSGSVGRNRGRQSSMPSLNSETEAAPEPPRRKSRERSIKSLTREGRVSDIGDDIVQTRLIAQHLEEIPPVAPLRKSRSRGTSLADDDRTSRGADSAILPDDDEGPHNQNVDTEDIDEQIMVEDEIEELLDLEDDEDSRYKSIEPVRLDKTLQLIDERMKDNSGYAVVTKGRKKPPPRPPLPPQQHFQFQSQLDTLKNTGKNIFFTYPRRAIKSLHKPLPSRQMRNYNTVGPVRPPRRNRVFRQPMYITGESPPQQETFADKERDLQSGEVVMKMKGRPLPPPPRPPRKTKDFDMLSEDYNSEIPSADTIIGTTEVKVQNLKMETKESRLHYLKAKKDEIFNSLQRYHNEDKKEEEEETVQTGAEKQMATAQQTSFDLAEVSVSIQTDPLPKDVIVIDQEIEETEEIFIISDNKKKEFTEQKEEISESESKIKTKPPIELNERRIEEIIQSQSQEEEDIETNIFQQALERVEAAKGVLKEARERVIPGSSSSLEEKKTREESPIIRGSSREALPASLRSDEVEKEETPPPLPARPLYTKPIPVSFPDKLHLSELDVDKLNVGEIQANKISVSEIESTCIEVTELTSRGGNLTVHGIELPPDFISNIVAQVTSQAQIQVQNQQLAVRELTPQRQMRRVLTPPPSIVVQTTSEPIALPEPIVPETEATEHIPQPRTTKSKGRKLQTRVIDDSEDELAYTMPKRREKAKSESKEKFEEESKVKCDEESKAKRKEESKSETEPNKEVSSGTSLQQANSLQLVGRLVSIWHEHALDGAMGFVQGVNSLFPEGEKRRDAQIALIILLILITGLILLGFGYDNSVHHHHWDYLPPR